MKIQCVTYTHRLAVQSDMADIKASDSFNWVSAYLEETRGGFIWGAAPSSV